MKSCIKKRPHAGRRGALVEVQFPAGYLAFFKLVASGPKSIQRRHSTPIQGRSQGGGGTAQARLATSPTAIPPTARPREWFLCSRASAWCSDPRATRVRDRNR